jgi:hypothetical protein
VRPAKGFSVALHGNFTVILLETGLTLPLEAVALETPAFSFLKAVQIEASTNQHDWQVLAVGLPLFRQDGVTRLELPLSGAWPFLRLTVNDQRSVPIPFTGATLKAREETPASPEPVEISFLESSETPGLTRLALNLGSANLDLVSLRFESADPLFTRKVTLAVRQMSENVLREIPISEDVIYRVGLDDGPLSAKLSVSVDHRVPSRELLVLIQNGDSPPLHITRVSGLRRPGYALFRASQAGSFVFLTGNPRASAPRYDLPNLAAAFKEVPVFPIRPTAPVPNPEYRLSEVLPEIQDSGAALDVAGWRFKKQIVPAHHGIQQVELDLDLLAHAQHDLSDLRLVRQGRQLPYILEQTSLSRPIPPFVTQANDPKQPRKSRWLLKLPRAGLPVNRLVCDASSALFKREMHLYEIIRDDRGNDLEQDLGQAVWTQTPERKSKQFSLTLLRAPTTDSLFLETDDGDNAPLQLANFQVYHPVTRILFKSPAAPISLYYGNRSVNAPAYDLGMVAPQILAAERNPGLLGAEEQLKATSGPGLAGATRSTIIFWTTLAAVVIALLALISRLLPKSG